MINPASARPYQTMAIISFENYFDNMKSVDNVSIYALLTYVALLNLLYLMREANINSVKLLTGGTHPIENLEEVWTWTTEPIIGLMNGNICSSPKHLSTSNNPKKILF